MQKITKLCDSVSVLVLTCSDNSPPDVDSWIMQHGTHNNVIQEFLEPTTMSVECFICVALADDNNLHASIQCKRFRILPPSLLQMQLQYYTMVEPDSPCNLVNTPVRGLDPCRYRYLWNFAVLVTYRWCCGRPWSVSLSPRPWPASQRSNISESYIYWRSYITSRSLTYHQFQTILKILRKFSNFIMGSMVLSQI